jgi:hypothetical protein
MQLYDIAPDSGEYIGTSEARESPLEPGVYLLPAHAVTTAPPDAQPGHVRCWNGTAWAQVEDHRGETVYAKATGRASVIAAPGPLPADVTTTAPGEHQVWDATGNAWVTDAAATNAARATGIRAQLAAVDAASARPLRAILAAQQAGQTPDAADVAKLAELEAQARTLRAELAG